MSLTFVERTIKSLKIKYGQPLTIKHSSPSEVDIDTGAQGSESVSYVIDKALDFSEELRRQLMPQGSVLNVGIKLVGIDTDDLPDDYVIDMDDTAEMDDEEYTVSDKHTFPGKGAILLSLKRAHVGS